MAELVTVRLTVNGVLTGTHVGCEHGICGACTILLNGQAARSCIMLAVQADGAELVTVEGLMQNGKLHPLQEAFREHHALQCGFCTPGMLLTALDLRRVKPDPSEADIREGISAVLCRCTGYHGVIKAVRAAAPTEAEIREGLSAVLCRCTGYQGIVNAVRAAARTPGGPAGA
ncbi:MAG: (2Fe-2S)-binding protein [Candidatus Rokubacteria bacterium]|nr:(2Fe-2S)-binding protein [Candidatus Rokubacteria bacterium]